MTLLSFLLFWSLVFPMIELSLRSKMGSVDAQATPAPTSAPRPNFVRYRYYPFNAVRWAQARTLCQAIEGRLASIPNSASLTQLRSDMALSVPASGVWNLYVDATDSLSEGHWQWRSGPTEGVDFFYGQFGTSNFNCYMDYSCPWANNQPDNSVNQEDRLAINVEPGYTIAFNDLSDNWGNTKGYICEFGSPLSFASVQYRGYTWSRVNTTDAQKMCRGYGGWIACAPNPVSLVTMNTLLRIQTPRLTTSAARLYTFGATDQTTPGEWVWLDGPSKGKTMYTEKSSECAGGAAACNFAAGQPSNTSVEYQIGLNAQTLKWSDEPPGASQFSVFVCEFELKGDNWRRYFASFTGSSLASPFIDPDIYQDKCAARGGWLGSIPDEEAFDQLRRDTTTAVGGPLYRDGNNQLLLGAGDNETEGTWKWWRGQRAGQTIRTAASCATPFCRWAQGGFGGISANLMAMDWIYNWRDSNNTDAAVTGYLCEFEPRFVRYRLYELGGTEGGISVDNMEEGCATVGGWPATFPDSEAWFQFATDVPGRDQNTSSYLVGASDWETEGTYKWTHGPAKGKTLWTMSGGCSANSVCPWAQGEPSNTVVFDPAGEDDMAVTFRTTNLSPPFNGWLWSDITQGSRNLTGYICEFPWYQRYRVYMIPPESQAKAQQYCATRNGWLATVPDASALQELKDVVGLGIPFIVGGQLLLLGADNLVDASSWAWTMHPEGSIRSTPFFNTAANGSTGFQWTNWDLNSTQPNASSIERYMAMDLNYKWHDTNITANNLRGFVCEFPQPVTGIRYVTIVSTTGNPIQLAEVKVFDMMGTNVAVNGLATARSFVNSSVSPEKAIDGSPGQSIVNQTIYISNTSLREWWQLDLLLNDANVTMVQVLNRVEAGRPALLTGAFIVLMDWKKKIIRRIPLTGEAIQTIDFRANYSLGRLRSRLDSVLTVTETVSRTRTNSRSLPATDSVSAGLTVAQNELSATGSLTFPTRTFSSTDRSPLVVDGNSTLPSNRPSSACPFEALANSTLLATNEAAVFWNNGSSTSVAPLCEREVFCAHTMRACTTSYDLDGSGALLGLSCDDAVYCTRIYMECLFLIAMNSTEAQCPHLKPLNDSLRSVQQKVILYNESAAYMSCASSSCRILRALRPDPTDTCYTMPAVATCPSPRFIVKPLLPSRLYGSPTVAVVSVAVRSNTAALGIVAAGTITIGIGATAGVSSLSSLTKAPVLEALTDVVQCAFTDEDTVPSQFDFPVPASIGTSEFAAFVGSGFATLMVLVVLPALIAFAVKQVGWRWEHGPVVQQKVIANGAQVAFSYFGPLMFRLILIIWHSRPASDIAIAVLCPVVILALALYLLHVVARQLETEVTVSEPEEESTELEFENKDPKSLFFETFGLLFDMARSMRYRHRLLYFEDLLVASILQLLAGVRPERANSCGAVASIMSIVCWLHSLYLLTNRPFNEKLELWLVIGGSLILSVMATLGAVITFTVPADEMEQSPLFQAFSYLGLGAMLYFFIQTGALAFAEIAEAQKERLEKLWDEQEGAQSSIGDGGAEKAGEQLSLDVAPTSASGHPLRNGTHSPAPPALGNRQLLAQPLLDAADSPFLGLGQRSRSPQSSSLQLNPLATSRGPLLEAQPFEY